MDSVPIRKNKIVEIEFSSMDMLPVEVIDSNVHPFNLRRVGFTYCREITPHRTAGRLAFSRQDLPAVTFNYSQPRTATLNQMAPKGSLPSMYYWRKIRPGLLADNLRHSVDFREMMRTLTGVDSLVLTAINGLSSSLAMKRTRVPIKQYSNVSMGVL